METRFEFRDFLKVFGTAIFLYVIFVYLLTLVPEVDVFFITLHPSIAFLIQYLLQFVILFCPLWFFVVAKYNARLDDFGFQKVSLKCLVSTVLLAYFAYVLLMLGIVLTLYMTGTALPGYEAQESHLPLFGQDFWGILIGFVLVGVFAPFLEEFLFRGFVYRVFVKIWPLWLGSVLSAVLFALIHVQFQTFIPLFILGLILNETYRRTGSVWTSVAFHSFNNILAFGLEVYLSLHPEALDSIAELPHFLYNVQIG
ncbi:CPBP family intramembrane metalloprotease [Candidatus Peregrinibacteria bacterium]|nr:MAG: CPBP family intramembrane metalloprotease [Candidatus Peregrinibacteria bacterium]